MTHDIDRPVRLEVVPIKDDDVIVVRVPNVMSAEEKIRLWEDVQPKYPTNRILILEAGVSLEVYHLTAEVK